MRRAAYFALAFGLAGTFGCKASVDAKVNVGGKDDVADFDKPMDGSRGTGTSMDGEAKEAALLGARQDLVFKGPATTTCKCLAVAVGQPHEAPFQWAGKRPSTSPSSQLVLAMSSAGVACPEAGASPPGASYWGYEVVGDDVVVVVENAAPGRPVGSGAIIPRPLGNGQVFVRPAGKGIPYGRPQSGSGDRCQVGSVPPLAARPGTTAAPGVSGGQRIHTDETDPMSTRTEIP